MTGSSEVSRSSGADMRMVLRALLTLAVIARLAWCADETTTTQVVPEDVCKLPCSDTDPGPVCAGDVVTPPVTFGSSCRLNEYNCRRHRSLEVIQKGPCDDEEDQFIIPNKIISILSKNKRHL